MRASIHQASHAKLWELAQLQHGVVTRSQLLELGYSAKAIRHRIAKERLHPLWRGIYAIGRPELTREGRWLAAVLARGPKSFLSHASAAALWMLRPSSSEGIHVSVPRSVAHRRPGIVVHRRPTLPTAHLTRHRAIPVTMPFYTLIDLATPTGRAPARGCDQRSRQA